MPKNHPQNQTLGTNGKQTVSTACSCLPNHGSVPDRFACCYTQFLRSSLCLRYVDGSQARHRAHCIQNLFRDKSL